ncbi:AcvB/VirJ family lysyl-phosphatidylglycerol hydrolase [Pedobacter sp. MR22-3]|uniref:AcvB/VirJ family lysyl-phosphatidylglycerol hydrolase n=1 Tax=Pedobacter TaxID=84567 RepID=UPI0022474F8E|nr:AcvB/VirJ family lysyl-phosphatidylglycerol hydrolase [Pedobacter sp. MR22-3]MCX2585763.1 hypothetical protein [Pedobacter sp. MR22-3]
MIKLFLRFPFKSNQQAMRHFSLLILLLMPAFIFAQDISQYPLSGSGKGNAKTLIFYISGDGGMNSFSQKIVDEMVQKNYSVVSLDSRKYFWAQKSPDQTAHDFSEIIQHYLKAYGKEEFSLVGYSFGADAVAFSIPRLPKELFKKLRSSVLLSPSSSTDFVVRVSDLIGFGSKESKYKTLPELYKHTSTTYCIFGKEEDSEFYKLLKDRKNLNKTLIPGSHKYDNDIHKVVATILTGI